MNQITYTTYTVRLESKDGQRYEYKCQAESAEDAKLKALKSIKDKGWDIYDYNVVEFGVTKHVRMSVGSIECSLYKKIYTKEFNNLTSDLKDFYDELYKLFETGMSEFCNTKNKVVVRNEKFKLTILDYLDDWENSFNSFILIERL